MSPVPEPARRIALGDCTVHPELREIAGPNGSVRVKPKSMAVLMALLEDPGRVWTRDELLTDVWKNTVVGEDVLTQAIAQLRKALGDDPKSPTFIETVPRRGYRLVAKPRLEDQGAPGPTAVRPSPFVGRGPELETLTTALEHAVASNGSVVFVSGEPGIGKTRLAEEALARARARNFLTLVGRCPEESGAPPMLPFVEIVERAARIVPEGVFRAALGDAGPAIARLVPGLRREFPDLPTAPEVPPEQQRRYLFNAFTDFLERGSAAGPICLFLDDLQWADEGTAGLLRHLAREAGRLRLLVLGTFRDTGLQANRAFAAAVAELIRQRVATRLVLAPLSGAEIGALLGASAGSAPPEPVVEFFARATDGNPFFVEELYAHLAASGATAGRDAGRWQNLPLAETEVPEGVRVVILQRAARLMESTRRFLTTAAVAGRSFDPELVRLISGPEDRETGLAVIEEGEAAGLIGPRETGRGLRYQFSHDLIRHAFLASLSAARRQRLHLEIAGVLETVQDGDDARAAEIAAHLERAGKAADPGRLLRLLAAAAGQAIGAAAHEDALACLDRALSLSPAREAAHRARLLHLRGLALRGLSKWEQALADWEAAMPLFEALKDTDSLVRICIDLATMAHWRGDSDAAIGFAERALARLRGDPGPHRARLLANLGLAHAVAGRFAKAEEILAEGEAIARKFPDPELLGTVLFLRSISAFLQCRTADWLALATQSVELLRGTANVWDFLFALAMRHAAGFCRGRWREIEGQESEAERLAERFGHLGTVLFVRHNRAWRELLETGDLAVFGAGADARAGAVEQAGLPWLRAMSRLDCALVAEWRGEPARALADVQAAREFEAGTPIIASSVAGELLARARGGDPGALDLLASHEQHLPAPEGPAGIGAWKLLAAAVEALALAGATERAAALHPRVVHAIDFTGALVLPWSHTTLARVAGISAAAAGRFDEAEGYLERAREQCERLPNRIERPFVLAWQAWMLNHRGGAGDSARARDLKAASDAAFRELGLDPAYLAPALGRP